MAFQRAQNGYAANTVTGKLNEFFDNRELPMYKDKPYSYSASRKIIPVYTRWRVVGGAVLMLLGLVYWFQPFSAGPPRSRRMTKVISIWSWGGKPEASVDWDGRREKVKEAFMLSWDGYERYAWGGSPTGEELLRFGETETPFD